MRATKNTKTMPLNFQNKANKKILLTKKINLNNKEDKHISNNILSKENENNEINFINNNNDLDMINKEIIEINNEEENIIDYEEQEQEQDKQKIDINENENANYISFENDKNHNLNDNNYNENKKDFNIIQKFIITVFPPVLDCVLDFRHFLPKKKLFNPT